MPWRLRVHRHNVRSLLSVLLAQAAISATAFRSGHGNKRPSHHFRPPSSFNFRQESTGPDVTSSTVTSTDPSLLVSTRAVAEVLSASASSGTPLTTIDSRSSTQTSSASLDNSLTAAPNATPNAAPSSPGSPTQRAMQPRRLLEIIVPVVLGILVVGLIFTFHRRWRRRQEAKGRAGSRLPESALGPSRRAPSTRRAAAYVGGGEGDWNRSDAHLRAEDGVFARNGWINPAEQAPDTSGQIELDEQIWDPDTDMTAGGHELFTGTFHSDSASHEEPALAESRPGSRNNILDSFHAPYVGPRVL
ncbi:hypothetical protein FB45DRAFT_922008 [Roridomyces roridus]|uniref:Uncharacterized protein n=1 Tax=Roridomyces roridus TaxID=1738132 RepID=A0AAD7BNI3_9AGAR|nr:hypothetical protein FB45DRAFT_922008 [Roridomyces roridus]